MKPGKKTTQVPQDPRTTAGIVPGGREALRPKPASLFSRLQTWHALMVAAVQIAGLTLWGWPALSMWLIFLWDDLGLAASSWVRTAWARTKAGEGWPERGTAVVGHAIIDLVTIAGLVTGLVVMTRWPEGETFGHAWAQYFGSGELAGVLTALGFTLLQWPAWWRADRSGELADIDEIRDSSGLLKRFLVANFALLLGLPFMGGSSADLAATLALVVLRTVWTVWFDARAERG